MLTDELTSVIKERTSKIEELMKLIKDHERIIDACRVARATIRYKEPTEC